MLFFYPVNFQSSHFCRLKIDVHLLNKLLQTKKAVHLFCFYVIYPFSHHIRQVLLKKIGFALKHLFYQQDELALKEASKNRIIKLWLNNAVFWLPHEDSNPDKQSQSLPCYRYTMGQDLTCFIIIVAPEQFVNSRMLIFLIFIDISRQHK